MASFRAMRDSTTLLSVSSSAVWLAYDWRWGETLSRACHCGGEAWCDMRPERRKGRRSSSAGRGRWGADVSAFLCCFEGVGEVRAERISEARWVIEDQDFRYL